MSDETAKQPEVPAPAKLKGKERFRNNGTTVLVLPSGRCLQGGLIEDDLDSATRDMWLENGTIVRA
mgnify:CR=1 FL=1